MTTNPHSQKIDAQHDRDMAKVKHIAVELRESRRNLHTVEPEPATAEQPSADQVRTIEELAALHPLEYDRKRAAAAQALGVRVSILDAEVGARRGNAGPADNAMFPECEPWPEPVDGATLLLAIGEVIRRHVIADRATIVTATLWVAHTYLLEVLTVSPIAHISAPEKRCGKTVLLSVIGRLVRRPLQVANISTAATFRAIEAWHPTLLVDEADAFMRDNEELRGVLNSGHTLQSAYVVRCDGEQHEPRRYSTWCPKAIAGIGRIAPTLEDRSVPMCLRRKLPGETVDNLRRAPEAQFAALRAKLLRWTADHAQEIGRAQPVPIAGLNDRENDNFEPLLAIADAAGGAWPKLAREAAIQLCGKRDDEAAGHELLAAIMEVFEVKDCDRLSSAALVEALVADTEGAWATWNRGRSITPRDVARMLRDYRIAPASIRLPSGDTPKGYYRHQFADAWERYLPSPPATPLSPATTPQAKQDAGFGDLAIRHTAPSVADEKTPKAKQDAGCGGVADTDPHAGEVEL